MSWEEQARAFREQQIVDNTQRIADSLHREEVNRLHRELSSKSEFKINTTDSYITGPTYKSFGKKLWEFFVWDTVVGIPVFALITFVGALFLSMLPLPAVLRAETIILGIPNFFVATALVGIIVWVILAIIKIKKLHRYN